MGALLDMCARPRNIFMEEAMEMKKKYHVSDEEEMKISAVRMADVSKNLKLDLSKKEFLEDVLKFNQAYSRGIGAGSKFSCSH